MTANSAQIDENQPNFDFIETEKSSALEGAQISSLDEVRALIAKKHSGKSVGSDDPIWMLYSMFEVFVSDLSVLLVEAETRLTGEREKLKAVVGESAKILAEQMEGELSNLETTLGQIRHDVEASSIEGLLKQQAQFSAELGALTSKLKRSSLPIYIFTALNWLAVGALYLIMK
ncbi:hypothetical protein [Pseudovibrio sp. Tun.PSC04-5.I4]|uniref:hypothetical protein n=1 Tax=Pseudovibrio sp. Tun.PSC04-5.I4 TaxID=1798213 RepID=UPI000887809E|nr:hypothetical protein [Pseudovibrio sp. Tun.PSC04-5.I4]SDR45180.1 hypothetical protein SAMN04515695_5516 [Pseudovibrio sp. Tun.PSC04-5.I4]